MSEDSLRGWSTVHELSFLRGLESHCGGKFRRSDLLSGYLLAAGRRTEWGQIDKMRVIAAANEAFKECK